MTTATFNPAVPVPSVDLNRLATGALVVDAKERVFMVIRVPGAHRCNGHMLVRFSAPVGFYNAEATAPFSLYEGSITLENDD